MDPKTPQIEVWTGRFEDSIGYIMISSWQRERFDALERAFEALEDFAGAKGLISDVSRTNFVRGFSLRQAVA